MLFALLLIFRSSFGFLSRPEVSRAFVFRRPPARVHLPRAHSGSLFKFTRSPPVVALASVSWWCGFRSTPRSFRRAYGGGIVRTPKEIGIGAIYPCRVRWVHLMVYWVSLFAEPGV
jgi:hypothetical protein